MFCAWMSESARWQPFPPFAQLTNPTVYQLYRLNGTTTAETMIN